MTITNFFLDWLWLRVISVLLSKMSITATYTVLYIFTPELFPTGIHATMFGCCSMIARLGSVSASYVAMWIVRLSLIK